MYCTLINWSSFNEWKAAERRRSITMFNIITDFLNEGKNFFIFLTHAYKHIVRVTQPKLTGYLVEIRVNRYYISNHFYYIVYSSFERNNDLSIHSWFS